MTAVASYGTAEGEQAIAEDIDAIVIGAGVGGMTTAALLGHEGKRVLVLERHASPGGSIRVLDRAGFKWTLGLNCVGEVHRPSSQLTRLFDRITDGKLRWTRMADRFERIVIGDRSHDTMVGVDAFKDQLKASFPDEARAIDAYVEAVFEINRTAGQMLLARTSAMGAGVQGSPGKSARQTTGEVLRSLTSNADLIAVLCGNYGYYTLLPDQASFMAHAIVAKHYIDGGSFPVGGAERLHQLVGDKIASAGGCVLVDARVTRIRVTDGRATGVEMADGRVLRAPVIVSAIGIAQTMRLLADDDAAGLAIIRTQCAALTPSQCYLTLHVGLAASDADLGLPASNTWWHPGPDFFANYRCYLGDPGRKALPMIFISPLSVKDPSWQDEHPARSTINVFGLSDWSLFARFPADAAERGGPAYLELTQRLTEEMLDQLYRFHPQTRGRVVHTELVTPLHLNHMLGRSHGDIVSFGPTPDRFLQPWMRAPSPVGNLFFAGQDVATGGVGGAAMSGVIAASAVLRRDLFSSLAPPAMVRRRGRPPRMAAAE